jgi:23S rRNA (cytosine1962-C5)-methyltransferase
MTYQLIDSGNGKKLERFGSYTLCRPCSQAVWAPILPQHVWASADASFDRTEKKGWEYKIKFPDEWVLDTKHIRFLLRTTDFGHLGIFAEQLPFWSWIRSTILTAKEKRNSPPKVLNLFAYSGGSSLAASLGGAQVCHVDAAKGMVDWARENAKLNGLEKAPIRWIVDDALKFLIREAKRGVQYDAIILDPPTFGRGAKGEIFKIEEQISPLLEAIKALLSDAPLFILFSCHTPGWTPITLQQLLHQLRLPKGVIEGGEMVLQSEKEHATYAIPSGVYAIWRDTWIPSR